MTALSPHSSLARRLDVAVLAAAAWLWLTFQLWPRAFDPSSAQFVCFGLPQAGQALLPQVLLGLANTGLHFFLMGAAMMLPTTAWLVVPAVARGESGDRALWIAGYLSVWCAVGLLAAASVQAAALVLPDDARRAWAAGLPLLLCVLAAAYQVSAWRARRFGATSQFRETPGDAQAAKACPCSARTTPQRIAANSQPAAWRGGVSSGVACAVRCTPFMLALHALAPSSLALMVAGTALMFVERWHYRIGAVLTAVCLLGAAAFMVVR